MAPKQVWSTLSLLEHKPTRPPLQAKMSTLRPQIELDSKSVELQHLDLNDPGLDVVKGEMAAEHEHIQKEFTLWQNLKLYRKVSDRLHIGSSIC
jgi:hypothetical protein